jgi:N-acetylglucosaminyldiphosphoundecaprenol N-acetyl-beta-D-mannosaminyltransferase
VTPDALPRVVLGGFITVAVTRQQLAEQMVADCFAARELGPEALPKIAFSSNGQGIAEAVRNPAFSAAMAGADYIHADGQPVVLASRFTKVPLPERIATTDFFHDAARIAAQTGLKFFILGAGDAQNAAAVEAMRRLYPELQVVGRRHGYFPDDESESVCANIRDSGADVVWVALGKPRQELWSVANRANLGGVGWIKTCGGLYAFLAGDAFRAPRWMQRLGLEWLYRMLEDPKRLGWRYLTTNPIAAWRLATKSGMKY